MASQLVICSQSLHLSLFVFVFALRHCYLHGSRALALNNVIFCQQHVHCTSVRNLSSFLHSVVKAQLEVNACFFGKWSVKSLMLKVRATDFFLLPLEGQVIEQVLTSGLGFKVIELEDALLFPG